MNHDNHTAGTNVPAESNTEIYERIHPDYFPYYKSWCHESPIFVSTRRDQELRRTAELLYRCCKYYVHHYKDYLHIISYPQDVLETLEYASKYPFRAGTFRPDYVIDQNGNLMLCEITSRFFGNGYFMSYFMEKAGEDVAIEAGLTDRRTYFPEFFDYMAEMCRGYQRLLVLKSADKSDSIKLYVPFYRALGMETLVLEAEEVESHLEYFEGSMIVSALNQVDLMSFSFETRKAMADHGMRNDFRTIFLLHDKRFFHLLFCDEFTKKMLNDEEARFLRAHTIRTAIAGSDPELWEDAASNKDHYIVKHHCLGKSEKVYAGIQTSQEVWDDIFSGEAKKDMILQPFIQQKLFSSRFREKNLQEYVSPSIFTVDDRYFGTGLFRTSSNPIINQGDAHKIAPVLSDQADRISFCHIL